MTYKLLSFFFSFLLVTSLNAYESESLIKVKIISKIIKYVTWNKGKSKPFIITVLDNPYGNTFEKVFENEKNIKIKYIDNINQLGKSNILYIPSKEAKNVQNILEKCKQKNILTISDIRGFADRKGVLQLSFVSQKIKLKINIISASKENLKFSSSLLRIADIVKK